MISAGQIQLMEEAMVRGISRSYIDALQAYCTESEKVCSVHCEELLGLEAPHVALACSGSCWCWCRCSQHRLELHKLYLPSLR